MKCGYVDLSVYLACVSFIVNFYASFITLLGVLAHFLIFIFLSCCFFALLWRYRIPQPKDSTFRSIFGSDWGAYAGVTGDKETKNDYVMKVVAHRACGLDAPENSLSALDTVEKEGITAVEFDVMITADKVPVVFHDVTLVRMTNLNKNVSEVPYDDIKTLDISVNHPFGKDFSGERIPTLQEYVTFCLEKNIRMFIDLKDRNDSMVKIISDLFKQYPKMYELSVVSSFNPLLIYNIRARDPKIACSLAWRPYYYSHGEYNEATGPKHPRTNNLCILMLLRILNTIHQWALWKFGYYLLGLSALLLHKDMVTRHVTDPNHPPANFRKPNNSLYAYREIVYYWNKRGVRVIAWSVNLPTEKQYFEKILEITYLTDTVINS